MTETIYDAFEDGADPEVLSPEARALYRALGAGAAEATKLDVLAERFGRDTRFIQELRAECNEAGFPVASSCSRPFGLFRPVTEDEVKGFLKQLRGRAMGCLRERKRFRLAIAAARARAEAARAGRRPSVQTALFDAR